MKQEKSRVLKRHTKKNISSQARKKKSKKVQRREIFMLCMDNIWIFLKILGIVPGISLFTEKKIIKIFCYVYFNKKFHIIQTSTKKNSISGVPKKSFFFLSAKNHHF